MVDAADELSAVVDPHAFDRIVSNLLGNAHRHGAPPVLVSAQRMNGELWVTVEDRGQGISDDFVGSLFERFTRGATGSGEGAGLGLSIAQTYARAHGGTLRYEPADPHGARASGSSCWPARSRDRGGPAGQPAREGEGGITGHRHKLPCSTSRRGTTCSAASTRSSCHCSRCCSWC